MDMGIKSVRARKAKGRHYGERANVTKTARRVKSGSRRAGERGRRRGQSNGTTNKQWYTNREKEGKRSKKTEWRKRKRKREARSTAKKRKRKRREEENGVAVEAGKKDAVPRIYLPI